MRALSVAALVATLGATLGASLGASGCASSRNTAHMREARYATDVPAASAVVRDALANYRVVERGSGRFETSWLRSGAGDVYQFAIHIDGPGDGPFMVGVDTRIRGRSGVETTDAPPTPIARERDRIVETIYTNLKALEVPRPLPDIPAKVSTR